MLAGYYSSFDGSTDVEPVSMDFANWIPVGDSIASVTTTIAADIGTDSNAANLLVGPPGFVVGGTVCVQQFGGMAPNGPKPGVTYRILFLVTTAGGPREVRLLHRGNGRRKRDSALRHDPLHFHLLKAHS